MNDPLAIVCNLPDAERRERFGEIQTMLQKRSAFIPQSDGVLLEWDFSEEIAHGLLEFILFERACCSGFRYELQFPPPHTCVRLRVTAPEEQVAVVQAFYC